MKELLATPLGRKGLQVLERLIAHGHQAYFVGGCVRDGWLGRPVQDMDIATSATPDQVMACFERTAPTGLKHGTVMVILGDDTFEVTTFRTESAYEQFRRPTEVKYVTSLPEDLQRRDFTMNAMAMDSTGQIIDPFGGRQDLEAGVLRSVGEAAARFGEDALRMLRCVRFAAEYGLRIEEATWRALCQHAPLLQHIAMERVRAELERIVGGAAPHRGLRLLVDSGLPQHFRQALGLPVTAAWRSPLAERALPRLGALAEPSARWALLLLLTEERAGAAHTALRRLTFARAESEAVAAVVAVHDDVVAGMAQPPAQGVAASLEAAVKLAAVAHGGEAAERWLRVIAALHAALLEAPDEAQSVGAQACAQVPSNLRTSAQPASDPEASRRLTNEARLSDPSRSSTAPQSGLQAAEGSTSDPSRTASAPQSGLQAAGDSTSDPSRTVSAPLTRQQEAHGTEQVQQGQQEADGSARCEQQVQQVQQVRLEQLAQPRLPLVEFLGAYGPLLDEHGRSWLASMPCTCVAELAVNGGELIKAVGRPGGPWTSELLQRLLRDVVLGRLPNDKAALLEATNKIMKE